MARPLRVSNDLFEFFPTELPQTEPTFSIDNCLASLRFGLWLFFNKLSLWLRIVSVREWATCSFLANGCFLEREFCFPVGDFLSVFSSTTQSTWPTWSILRLHAGPFDYPGPF